MFHPTDNLPVRRTRLAICLLALAAIALELALMRMLSLRFWSHFAYMVICVAILGFGASGRKYFPHFGQGIMGVRVCLPVAGLVIRRLLNISML